MFSGIIIAISSIFAVYGIAAGAALLVVYGGRR